MIKLLISAIVLFFIISISSCFQGLMHPQPTRNEMENIFSGPYGTTNNNLHTTDFYYNNTLSESDSLFFTYLSFKPSGTVIYFSNTSMTPDTLAVWDGIWNPVIKKNGIPKSKTVDFGFYKSFNDSVYALIHVVGLFGSWDYYNLKGQIHTDSLIVEIEKTGKGSHTEQWKTKPLKFIHYKTKK